MNELIANLKSALKGPLPGLGSHDKMMRVQRPTPDEIRKQGLPFRESAVLILLYPINQIPHTMLMRRPSYDGVHSGQVSFPGGKMELEDKDLIDTALREADEEVSIKRKDVEIIGMLSELYIPPSQFIVQPVVAYTNQEPNFIPDAREVEQVIPTPLSRIMDKDVVKEKDIFLPKYDTTINTSYFDINSQVVWGATAMMLAELRKILEEISWQSK